MAMIRFVRAALILLLCAGCGHLATGRGLGAAPKPLGVNVFGEGFASQNELKDFVARNYEGINNEEPFKGVSRKILQFNPVRLAAGTLGVNPVADIVQCYFTFESKFDKELRKQKKNHPGARMNIVLVKGGDGGVGACAMSNDLIVTSEFVDMNGIMHELGHAIGGLKDETSGGGPSNFSTPHIEPNCADVPGWTLKDLQGVPVSPLVGCEGFDTVVSRPTDDCRMSSPDLPFCCICTSYMKRHLADLLKLAIPPAEPLCTIPRIDPSSGSGGPIAGVLVTASFGKEASGEIEIGERTLSVPELAAGDNFVTLIVNNTAVATVGLPDPPTVARAYRPKDGVEQRVAAPIPITVTFFVPGVMPGGVVVPRSFLLPRGESGTKRLDAVARDISKIIETTGIPP